MDSSIFSDINWLAVLVACVAYYILGAIWYSFLFKNKWIAYQNIDVNSPDAKSHKGVAGVMVTAFVLFFIVTLGLALLIGRIDPMGGVMSGVKIGLLTGICFSAMILSITYLYTMKPMGLHFIDGAFHVVGQVIAAVILCAWK
jgi:hypothetical protein